MTAGVFDPLIWEVARAEAKLRRICAEEHQLAGDRNRAEAAVYDARKELDDKVNEHVEQVMRGNE